VRESLQLLRGSLPSTILIEEDIAEDCGPVSADPTQMHQVVINLCANASHAMRERGGVLRVALRDVEVDADLASKHPDLRPGPHARLTVADTGCGMDAATLARIFEPYFTTKPVGEGTGLGLATVHGIVRSHRGAILVESQVGRGSAFDVYLPHSAVGSPRPDGGEAAGEPLRGTERIMFVDDERPIVQLGQMALEGLGYKVTAFAGGAEALEALRADPSAFDLLITDQTMPNVTGMELAREARRLRPDLPVILCTGFSEAVDEAHPERMGCSACLRKPLSKRDLGQAIRRALDARRRA
jgi:CheY-like chemotaxis protein